LVVALEGEVGLDVEVEVMVDCSVIVCRERRVVKQGLD
jgi:hypothetical protein